MLNFKNFNYKCFAQDEEEFEDDSAEILSTQVNNKDYLQLVTEGLTQNQVLTTTNEADMLESLNFDDDNLLNNKKCNQNMQQTQKLAVFYAKKSVLNLQKLVGNYNWLIKTAPNNKAKTEFKNDKKQTQILVAVMFNIYKVLGGTNNNLVNNFVEDDYKNLSFCQSLQKAKKQIKKTINYVIKLKQVVNIKAINRQLVITLATLNNNKSLINKYLKKC